MIKFVSVCVCLPKAEYDATIADLELQRPRSDRVLSELADLVRDATLGTCDGCQQEIYYSPEDEESDKKYCKPCADVMKDALTEISIQ